MKISNRFQLPKIPRIITEVFVLKSLLAKQGATFIKIGLILALMILAAFLSFDIYKNFRIRNEVLGERQKIQSEVQRWEGIKNEHKDYRDAYFKLAILYYQLKDFENARKNLQKVFVLDPNFEKGRELEKLL